MALDYSVRADRIGRSIWSGGGHCMGDRMFHYTVPVICQNSLVGFSLLNRSPCTAIIILYNDPTPSKIYLLLCDLSNIPLK